jgi:hypothetical protein
VIPPKTQQALLLTAIIAAIAGRAFPRFQSGKGRLKQEQEVGKQRQGWNKNCTGIAGVTRVWFG